METNPGATTEGEAGTASPVAASPEGKVTKGQRDPLAPFYSGPGGILELVIKPRINTAYHSKGASKINSEEDLYNAFKETTGSCVSFEKFSTEWLPALGINIQPTILIHGISAPPEPTDIAA